jgi:hypothetical protein
MYIKQRDSMSLLDFEAMQEQALAEIAQLEHGDLFILQDLFVGIFWRKVQTGDRKTFGRLFALYLNENANKLVEYTEKTSSNQRVYRKIG